MDGVHQLGELGGPGVVACEQDHTSHQRVAQELALLGGDFGPREVDHQRAETHAGAGERDAPCGAMSSASDSTCAVCGNMSTTPAAASANPCSCTNTPRSRARLPGWQEIYNSRCGASRARAGSTARAPVRGGSSSTWL